MIEPSRFDCSRITHETTEIKRQDTIYGDKPSKDHAIYTDNDTDETSMLETDPEERDNCLEDGYLVMGFHRGQIVIYNIYKMDMLMSRHEVCRNKILCIREVVNLKMYLVYDDTHTISLCQLTDRGTKHIHQFNIFRSIFDILVNMNNVYIAYE